MSNAPYKPSEKKAKEICDEIRQKKSGYEGRMQQRLYRWVEDSRLYCGKSVTIGDNKVTSANSSELFKAIRAMRCMCVRMLLGHKPSFELSANDILGFEDPSKLVKAEHYVQQVMDLAGFEAGLAKALDQLFLFGTAVVYNVYEPLRAPFLGRRQYVTTYKPIPLINCAFALDSDDVKDSSWNCISSIGPHIELTKLLNYDKEEKIYNHAAIRAIQEQKEYKPELNPWMEQRLISQGYTDTLKCGFEKTIYHGPLDCMGDDQDYCVEIGNIEHIYRMESYDGLSPVRIATVNNIDDPLGNGLGDMFRPLLNKIDMTESALLNMIVLAGANMFTKQKNPMDEDSEFQIRQFGIMSLDSPDLNAIGPNPANLTAVAGYLADKIQNFRQASGATDILQAVVDNNQATATASSLAMNEAVRSLSVTSQLLSQPLVANYVKMILQNAQKYNREPLTVDVSGIPMEVRPDDLRIDVNVRVKTVTDQDFRPARLQRLREAIQLMAMFPPNAVPGLKMNPSAALQEYLKILDVPNYQESVQPITEEDMMMSAMAAQMGMGGAGGRPVEMEGSEPEEGTIKTPVGEVLAAPSDAANVNQTIREAA